MNSLLNWQVLGVRVFLGVFLCSYVFPGIVMGQETDPADPPHDVEEPVMPEAPEKAVDPATHPGLETAYGKVTANLEKNPDNEGLQNAQQQLEKNRAKHGVEVPKDPADLEGSIDDEEVTDAKLAAKEAKQEARMTKQEAKIQAKQAKQEAKEQAKLAKQEAKAQSKEAKQQAKEAKKKAKGKNK